jgi:DNA modification methylase
MTPYNIYNQDCVAGMAERLQPESVDLMVSSIPFGALFMYSGKKEDIGNNHDGVDMMAGQFGLHMRFFVEQLFRVMKPGRNVCIHIQQLLKYKNQHGYMGRRDFRGAVIELFSRGGFEWTGECVIPKNPQVIAQRLSLHSLMFITAKTSATKLAPAVNDYVMIFQKPGEPSVPVPAMYDPDANPAGWMTSEQWIHWASGLWEDIQETDVLDGWKSARETDEEKHVCPLQLSVIFRLISMYSNPADIVLDPFMGIGSTAYVAMGGKTRDGVLREPRQAVGFELKETYYQLGLRNLGKLQAEQTEAKNDLFALAGVEKPVGGGY